jgi:hypothetical protein
MPVSARAIVAKRLISIEIRTTATIERMAAMSECYPMGLRPYATTAVERLATCVLELRPDSRAQR